MFSRSGYPQNPHKTQGGWINFAIMAVSALAGAAAKKKAAKQASAAESDETRLRDRELALAEKQDARAEQLYRDYREIYQPREKALVEEAFGDELSPARAEARATTDVRDALDTARGITTRDLQRRGVDPMSGNALALDRENTLDAARMEAGARTRAREGTRDKNFARQLDTLSLGRNLPAQASSMTSQAQSGMGHVVNLAAARSRYSQGLAYDAASDFGASIAELGAEAYDLYKGRKSKTPAERGGSWG